MSFSSSSRDLHRHHQKSSVRTRKTLLKTIDYPPQDDDSNSQQQQQRPTSSSSSANSTSTPSFTKIMLSGSDTQHWTPMMEWMWRISFVLAIIGLIICVWVIVHELNSSYSHKQRSELDLLDPDEQRRRASQAAAAASASSWWSWLTSFVSSSSSSVDLDKDLLHTSALERAEIFKRTQRELHRARNDLESSKLGLAETFEKHFFREKTIFVSIASFRDVKCRLTVEDIFEKAVNPRRINLGIIEQNEHGDPSCIPERFRTNCIYSAEQFDPRGNFFCPLDNVRRRRVPSVKGRGPTYGRYVSMLMYRGESYYMMIDSHNRFKPKWDMDATKMLFLADSKKPVLSHYPLAWHRDTNFEKPQYTTVMCRAHFVSFGYVRMGGLNFVNSKRPRLQPLTAAGLIFADAAMVHEVPFDPHLDFLFDGEELLYTVRLYTHGWDSFSPSHNFVFHDYDRHTAPRFWHISSNQWGVRQGKSVKRVQWLLKIPHKGNRWENVMVPDSEATPEIRIESEKYGLGKTRSLESFWKFANIDLLNKVDNMGVCNKYTEHKGR